MKRAKISKTSETNDDEGHTQLAVIFSVYRVIMQKIVRKIGGDGEYSKGEEGGNELRGSEWGWTRIMRAGHLSSDDKYDGRRLTEGRRGRETSGEAMVQWTKRMSKGTKDSGRKWPGKDQNRWGSRSDCFSWNDFIQETEFTFCSEDNLIFHNQFLGQFCKWKTFMFCTDRGEGN